jgi:zeaxanthin glucosyltransferase
LQDPTYRERANYFQKVIAKTRGLDVAAEIIEQTFQKYQQEVRRDHRSFAQAKHKTAEAMQEA